jgi:hypothetical protein
MNTLASAPHTARDLKPLSAKAIPQALEKAKHYRLLNEPGAAESICRDILRVRPGDQETLVVLALAMSDHFGHGYVVANQDIQEVLGQISDPYQREYYSGLVWERRALAQLRQGGPGAGFNAYECLRQAMRHYANAEKEPSRPKGNDDPVLRWNYCVRLVERNRLEPRQDPGEQQLE